MGCSRKKDKFINRSFHAVTTEYNVLFNGYNALEEERVRLNESYIDNYWDVLPIERMTISDEVKLTLGGVSDNANFARAEEKAVKAIQKHGMNIKGKEKNPKIDEAYLLLGKARYFDQRFVPALEAFNYILYKYPASDKINQAKIWREKTNIRLDNNEIAIENLKRLLEQEHPEGQDLADATSMLAQAYLNTKSVDSAITQLEIAANATKNNDERGRYQFIQGQLYNTLGDRDNANTAFAQVVELKRKTPRVYFINAQLEKIKNFNYSSGDSYTLFQHLTDLEENRENRPFLDKIYYEKAHFFLNEEEDSLAVVYFNKSLRTNSPDKILNAKNYEILGNMNFDRSLYKNAGHYYDSTLASMEQKSKPYRIIKRKRDNLDDVIYYEEIAKMDDSILHLIKMPEAERMAYFEAFTKALKEKDEAEKLKAEAAEHNAGLATVNNNMYKGFGGNAQSQGAVFYFYNPTTVGYGKNEFVKVWGNRPLEDNWRWSNKALGGVSGGNSTNNLVAVATETEKYDPEFYMSKIPSEEKVIDSISKERDYAYYQLGLIYKEKFKELELAKDKFENLLGSNPEERLVLPSKYNLYKIYEALGETGKVSVIKKEIVSGYPDSRYAAIINNPDSVSERDNNSPESLYEILYAKYENQEYDTVINKSEAYIKMFDGDPIVPKFELLKANALGRLYGLDAYSKAINYLAVTYANTLEGQQAQNIENNVVPALSNSEFVQETDSLKTGYKVVFKFNSTNKEQVKSFKETLDGALKNVKYYSLSASADVYNPDTVFVVVHGISNKTVAVTFNQLLTEGDNKKITVPYFVVAAPNYQIIQIHKNLDHYLSLNTN
ncbi:MAG: tetratricopeptide repeat protein [Aestuariibaculum sp.]